MCMESLDITSLEVGVRFESGAFCDIPVWAETANIANSKGSMIRFIGG